MSVPAPDPERPAPARVTPPRRTLAAAAAVAVLLAALLVVVLGGGEEDSPPPAALATRLVPADALVYLHLSTDTGRPATADAEGLAKRFPGYETLRRNLIRRLSAPGCPVAAAALRDGREAALALVDTGGGNAGSLIYVDTGDTKPAPERSCGGVQTGKFGRFLVVGQPQTLVMARNLASGRGRSLAADARYRRALAGLPQDRVADAWVSRDGVKRLLAPQGGVLGVMGILLDQPGLEATAAAVVPSDDGARVVLRSLRDPKAAAAAAGTAFAPFEPSLAREVPDSALAYLGFKGLTGAAGRLLGLASGQGAALAPLLARAGRDLAPLLALFSGEVAVTITPDTPAPILTLITRASDPAKAKATLAAARPKVARLLAAGPDDVPQWKTIGDGFRLRPASGVELDYAVVGDLVVVSTRQAGLTAVRDRKGRLTDSAGWQRSVGDTGNPITSLVFLDFNQLLRLGEQTGLNDSRAYLAAKDDLQRLRTVGARSSSEGDESTVELFLSFP